RARAFCVALSAAITVIIASTLGLPVSSTHIAVGGVFGVGFLREYLSYLERRKAFIALENAQVKSGESNVDHLDWETRKKRLEKLKSRKLVRRSQLVTIVAAWVITVPLAAILSAILYFIIMFLTKS
ncbi:MAG: inorganic phosphate transporter, partial [Rhodospirillales bacterium]|nr:inorganic phosphate transporter [Rhodospirillales bacterium]